jgi:GT2 family glycosyltransferase
VVRASLIVLNYNGQEVIGTCLSSLLEATSEQDEIIVVDNASPDGSAELVPSHPRIRLLAKKDNNFIFGLNDGLQLAQGKYVAFLNNDIRVEPGFVEAALDEFDSQDVFAVCPRILQTSGEDQGALTSGRFHRGLWFYDVHSHDDTAHETFFAVGGQSFFDAEKLRLLGSIDPLLWPMYHEDIELSLRAWKAGFVIRFAGLSRVWHIGGHSSSRAFTTAQLRSFVRQNEFLTVWKLSDTAVLIIHLGVWLPLRLTIAAIHRDWPTLLGFRNAARRIVAVRRARRIARHHHRLTDAQLRKRVSHVGLGIGTPTLPAEG